VPLELMTPEQAAALGVDMDVQAARQRYEAAREANDPREGMLAEAAISAAQAGTGRNAQRVKAGRMAAVDKAVAEGRPVNAAALEQWAQVPLEGAGFDASGNIPRRGIPAGYQKQGDVYTSASGATSSDARVPAADATPGLAGVSPAGRTGFKNLEPGGRSAGFVNGQILAEAEALIRAGVSDFAAWSKAMVTRFGQAIRQYLQGIWEQVVAALPNDAAKNVRLGAKSKGAPVSLAQGGFVMGPGEVKETRSRFARPEEQERLYQVREDVTVKAAAEAWVDSMPMEQAVAAMEAGRLPADMTGDVAQHAAGLLIQRTTEMMKSGSEVVQMQARSLGHRISKVWQGWLSQEAGRNLRQRSVVNSELTPFAPILAAEGMLIDRADAVMDKRFDGGATGGATKVNETAADAGDEAGESLADDLEGDTPERKALKDRVRKQMAPAKKKLNKAQRTADRILQQLSERYADPPLMDANGVRKVDPVRALYKQHVQAPMTEAEFVRQMVALGVPDGGG
jgi:hypothetical protein